MPGTCLPWPTPAQLFFSKETTNEDPNTKLNASLQEVNLVFHTNIHLKILIDAPVFSTCMRERVSGFFYDKLYSRKTLYSRKFWNVYILSKSYFTTRQLSHWYVKWYNNIVVSYWRSFQAEWVVITFYFDTLKTNIKEIHFLWKNRCELYIFYPHVSLWVWQKYPIGTDAQPHWYIDGASKYLNIHVYCVQNNYNRKRNQTSRLTSFLSYLMYCLLYAYVKVWKWNMTLTLVLLNLDMPCLCKQCSSRSVGFWRSKLIWICTLCHPVFEVQQRSGSSNLIGWKLEVGVAL